MRHHFALCNLYVVTRIERLTDDEAAELNRRIVGGGHFTQLHLETRWNTAERVRDKVLDIREAIDRGDEEVFHENHQLS